MVTGKSFASDFRKPPTLVKLWVVDQDMAAPEDVTELIDIEAMCLEVREDRGLLRRKALGRLHQPAAVAAVAGGQLDEQADPGAHPFGLRLAGLGTPRGRPDRGAWHVARLLGRPPHAAHEPAGRVDQRKWSGTTVICPCFPR